MTQSIMDAKEREIDGEVFRVRMLDPLEALDLEVDILKAFGPALAAVASLLLKSEDTKGTLDQLMDGVRGSSSASSLEELGGSLPSEAQGAIKDLIGDGLEGAVIGLVDRLSKDQIRRVVSTMMAVSSVKKGDKWPELSMIGPVFFRGRIRLLHKWLAFAVMVQYRDF